MSYESGKIYRIPLDQDYVVQPPVWEDHRRARNWLARIEEDPDVPGGIVRHFAQRGRGRFKYTVPLVEGDLIEFGADRIWAAGDGRMRCRWVGEVLVIKETEMQVRYYDSPEEMFAAVYDRKVRTQEAM